MKNDPKWWNEKHEGAWDRVKSAMKRDWEQTKADFSKKKGLELNQNAADTVKQAAGSERIPPLSQPNPEDGKTSKAADIDWDRAEQTYRYGVGARQQYGSEWDDTLEGKLRSDWSDMKSDRSWDDAKPYVRRGYDGSK